MALRVNSRPTTELGPYAALLATLVAMLLVTPLVEENRLFGTSHFRIFVAAILLAGVYAVSRRGARVLALGVSIVVPALALELWLQLAPSPALVTASFALSGAFVLFLVVSILYGILDQERVTLDTILGGVCIYLLLGTGWMLAYSWVEYVHPGSFRVDGLPLPAQGLGDDYRREDLTYFSFVTLTTVGYGDVLAKSPFARALAAAEAVVGSLYLAVFIARLVGLHMAHQRRELDL